MSCKIFIVANEEEGIEQEFENQEDAQAYLWELTDEKVRASYREEDIR